MSDQTLDVAIVGAGPAGAFAAYLLARQGARVRVFDPSHPREKPCGGGVTGRALALVTEALGPGALGPQAIAGVPISTARFDAPPAPRDRAPARDRSAAVQLDMHGLTVDSSLIVMSRLAFDRALLQAAVAAGAVHEASRVTNVESDDNGATVTTAAGAWRASYVFGADGANSFVRRRLGHAFERRQLSIATGFFAHGVTSQEIVIRFVTKPQGYIWSFPRADHLAIGICAQADESQPAPLRAEVARWIDASRIATGARLEPYSWPIPSLHEHDFAHEQPAGPRWMLLGDAAGLVDPITREGIFFALRSAQMAVDAIARNSAGPSNGHRVAEIAGDGATTGSTNAAAQRAAAANGHGRDRGEPSALYRAALAHEIYPELERAARVKRNFFRGPFTRLLIDALQRSEPTRAIMRDLVAGEQPYRTLRRRLLGTFEVGLAWQLLKLRWAGRHVNE